MAIDKDAVWAAIDAGRENAYGPDSGTSLVQRRASAIEAYLGLNVNPAPEGRSQIVDRTVFQTVQTILPSLVRIFVSSNEEIVKLVPVGPEDEAAAEQTTAVLNHVVTQQNEWEQICADWIHDAALMCNGYCWAYWDETEKKVRERYDGQSEDQLAMLMQDSGVTVIEHSQSVDKEATAQAREAYQKSLQMYRQAAQSGQQMPPPPPPPGDVLSHDVVIERKETDGKVCIKVLPPESCYIDMDTPSWMLDDCRYFEYRREVSISDLRAMGLDVPEDISDDESLDDGLEGAARDRFGESSSMRDDGRGSSRLVKARMIWVDCDAEGDGYTRKYYVLAVGRTELYVEPCGRIPVSSMTPQPMPHRHIGMSLAEQVLDVQEVKTAIKRGALDNLYLANNGRHVVSAKVNLEDFLDARPGGVVRMLDTGAMPGEGHIVPLTHPFAFDSIVGSLEYFDGDAQNRSGASRYFAGTDAGALNKTASGISQLTNQASQRVEHIARMMAPAVERLFGIVLEVLMKHANKPLTIQLKGKWTSVDPQCWRTKRDVRISVGVGAGNKESMQGQLMNIFQAQMSTMQMGLAGPEHMHATLVEMAKLAGFANPAKFWRDPDEIRSMPPQPSPDQVKAQSAMQMKQMDLQADAQKFQAQTELEFKRLDMEYQKEQEMKRAELAVQSANDERDSEREAQAKVLEAEMKGIEQRHSQALESMKIEVEKYKADLDAQVRLIVAGKMPIPSVQMIESLQGSVQALTEAMQSMTEDYNAPAEIMRDQGGRAVGVRKGSRVMSVVRDPQTGKAVGVQ